MKYNIYLLSYNNYYNRQVKKLSSIQDYVNGGYQIGQTILDCNFAMKDGIMSEILVNQAFVTSQPDYVLIAERGEGGVENGVFSRWFIIDSDEVRGNQYKFILKRDICVDYYDLMMNSQYFIERGYVSDANDLIFNSEGQRYSQIKTDQTPLYDETGVSWIVGYLPKKINKTSDTTVKATYQPDEADITVNGLSTWDYWQYVSSNPDHTSVYSDNVNYPYRFVVQLPIENHTNNGTTYQMGYFGYDAVTGNVYGADVADYASLFPNTFTLQETGFGYFTRSETNYNSDVADKQWYNVTNTSLDSYIPIMNRAILNGQHITYNGLAHSQMIQAFKAVYNPDNDTALYLENNINGRTIKDTNTGKVYTISLVDRVVDKLTGAGHDLSLLKTRIRFILNLNASNSYGTSVNHINETDADQLSCIFCLKSIQIELTEIGVARTTIPKDDTTSGDTVTIYRNHTVDQIYDMFAIPYKGYHTEIVDGVKQLVTTKLTVKEGANTFECNPEISLNVAQSIVTTLGYISGTSPVVYDLQILPYCPCREFIQTDNSFDITGAASNKFSKILYGQNLLAVGFVFFCSSSKVDNVTLLDKYNNFAPYSINIINLKRSYNLDVYRISGPNFASSFEFNPSQNGGVESFKMSFTYKPFNPYIRVRPDFKRMFGEDFKDGRGLILQGDFSVATMSDNWINYELNNKNYLNAFNREIASMRLQNDVAHEQDQWKILSGIVQGTVGGAVAGGMAGGPYGAIAGAVGGLALSSVGGYIDYQNNEKLRNDAISKAKNLFTMNLENIKAIPNTIRNIGCLTIDNLLVPVLEYYTASENEADAYDKKIRYYGMAINKVGSIIDYINPLEETFIQGYLLRLLAPVGVTQEADNHLAEELSNELSKGLYIGG